MKYAAEIAPCGVMYELSFMKIGTGVQAIVRIVFRNLRGCNVGITGGRDLLNVPLKWPEVA
jgi:hypothetical protein